MGAFNLFLNANLTSVKTVTVTTAANGTANLNLNFNEHPIIYIAAPDVNGNIYCELVALASGAQYVRCKNGNGEVLGSQSISLRLGYIG